MLQTRRRPSSSERGSAVSSEHFVVRVNRGILAGMAAIGGLFFLVGLDFTVFHAVFPAPDSTGAYLGVLVFFLGVGGVIVANCVLYLPSPPVMLALTPEGLSFGTGFRYTPFTLPWSVVERVGYGVDGANATALAQLFAGVQVSFRDDPSVPQGLATSAGISFAFRQLTLHWLYMDRLAPTVVAEVERFKQQYTR